jgi:hypothetical protein
VKISRIAPLAFLLATLVPALAAGADIPLPPPPSGTALQGGGVRSYKFAVLGGFLSQSDVASATVELDLGLVSTPPGWKRVQFEWHLPVRAGRPKWDGTLSRTVLVSAVPPVTTTEPVGTTRDTVWLVEAIPSARLILPVATGFALHIEAGIGLSQSVETHIEDQIYVGRTEVRKLVLAPIVRGAIGLTYRMGERLDLVMEPFVLGSRIGTGDSSFSALWGISYRL